jgi:A/G-specific adenine glycosylase
MKSINEISLGHLHRNVIGWYRRHQRVLQWRTTTKPYEILVSEIMLQQTQVSRVQEKLPLFLKRFPSIHALAKASKADVIRAWHGMGYNNRAVRLSELAKTITTKYRNRFPSDIADMQTLPGIGPYTAHAMACFAFRQTVPVVDVNIRRVLSRVFWKMKSVSDVKTEKEIWALAQHVLPRNAYIWNQALMDIGATICTARKPLCNDCPVAQYCKSRTFGSSVSGKPNESRKLPSEPVHLGIPRRIWRGKIIQILRRLPNRRSISLIALGKTMRLKNNDTEWISAILHQLEKDGVVSTTKRSSQTFVSLAA